MNTDSINYCGAACLTQHWRGRQGSVRARKPSGLPGDERQNVCRIIVLRVCSRRGERLRRSEIQSQWFDDPEIVRQFPGLYRHYARYCRGMVDRETGLIRGGTALFKVVRRMQRSCGLATSAGIRYGEMTIYLDLTDTRMVWVLPELMQASAEHRILHTLLKPGDTFVDIGANHGSFSVMASEIVGNDGLVIAFEPQPKLASLVRQSLTATAKASFRVHEAGCSDRNGSAEFFIPRAGSGSAGIFPSFSARNGHRNLSIQLATLDEALSAERITGRMFIKLDIEGSEFSALMGARKTVEQFRPTILFELNPESSRAAGHTTSDLLGLLNELGYHSFCEMEEFPKSRELDEIDTSRQRNLLALHK